MKKRNIIIISVSVVALLFGGLVFLGVSAFPELLEDEENKENLVEEVCAIETPVYEEHVVEEAPVLAAPVENAAPAYVVEAPSFGGSNILEAVSSEDKVIINKDVIPSFFVDIIEHFVDIKEVSEVEEAEEKAPIIEEVVEEKTTESHISVEEHKRVSHSRVQDVKRTETSGQRNIVETIILVLCVVEMLSFIFLKRKRHPRLR